MDDCTAFLRVDDQQRLWVFDQHRQSYVEWIHHVSPLLLHDMVGAAPSSPYEAHVVSCKERITGHYEVMLWIQGQRRVLYKVWLQPSGKLVRKRVVKPGELTTAATSTTTLFA